MGKLRPELFLSIPEVGFIPWAITGNRMPPYFDPEPLQQKYFHQYVQDGDIFLATMGKAGTMWLSQIVHLLKHKGDDSYNHLQEHLGYMEMLRYPDDIVEERIARENKKRTPGVPMSWFSHKFPNVNNYGFNVKKHPKVKYIGIAREGKEVVRSLQPFINAHSKEQRAMWGGFPPPMDKQGALKFITDDIPDFYFGYLEAWWAVRHEPNVLLLHFSDLKADLPGQVKRIADFLGIDPTAYVDKVLEKASFKYMKANPKKFLVRIGKNLEFLAVDEGGHIRSGETGGLGSYFTAEMNATWDQANARHWGAADPAMVAFASQGYR